MTDDAGIGRIRMAVDGDGCRIVMLDQDGFERIALTAQPDIGAVAVQSRAHNRPTRVDLFALDPMTEMDSAGFFPPRAVAPILSVMLDGQVRSDTSNKHLIEFVDDQGPILERRDAPNRWR